jgi:hypothetical protein
MIRPSELGHLVGQGISFVGALLILGAYTASQLGWLRATSRAHGVFNAIGGALVALIAAYEHQPSVVLLEGCWALISLRAVVRGERAAGTK